MRVMRIQKRRQCLLRQSSYNQKSRNIIALVRHLACEYNYIGSSDQRWEIG